MCEPACHSHGLLCGLGGRGGGREETGIVKLYPKTELLQPSAQPGLHPVSRSVTGTV